MVELPSADEKVYYKFVVDDQWIVDENAPKEDDGHYNVNNILLPSQITRHFPTKAVLADEQQQASDLRSRIRATSNPPRVLATSHAPPGSFGSDGALKEAPTVSAGGEGAPLLSKEQSDANLARWIPHVPADPNRPVTRTLSQEGSASSAPAKAATAVAATAAAVVSAAVVSAGGATLLSKEQSEANLARGVPNVAADPNRPVTRSLPQTDGASASKPEKDDIPGAFPETPAGEPQNFMVAPLPATGHSDVQSSVTTSKEAYENAGGEGTAGGNASILPVLPTGQQSLGSTATTSKEDYEKVGGGDDQQVSVNPLPATGHKDTQSSVTTSKEDYEKAGALGVAGAAIAGAGAYVASAFSKPKAEDKNKGIIPESSLPMNPDKTDTTDAGPFINSAGPGTTTAALAAQVPVEQKRQAQVVDSDAFGNPATPFLSTAGPGATTAGLASQVPLEPKRDAAALNNTGSAAPEAPEVLKDETASPFISSAGPGTTTAALASQVPLEQKRQGVILDNESAPSAVAAEKAAVEEELLQKVPESQATGASASAAAAQTSYYGLATTVPETVEKSISQAGTSPEAATDSSAVAEKSAVERELQATVPVVESAGEPAPTLSAATATTAPGTASADLTDGKTANEPVPGTDTGSQAHGLSAGEIAGGAAVGGTAAASAAVLAAKHNDKNVEPPRVGDSQKPSVTSEAAPATQIKDGASHPAAGNATALASQVPGLTALAKPEESVASPVAGVGAASSHPGVSPVAGAALSDGTEPAERTSAIQNKAPAETSEATATEYAPPRAGGLAPGVSPSAAAALSDGTEDPTLSEEPAVKMMQQNEGPSGTATGATTGANTAPAHDATTIAKPAGTDTSSKAATTEAASSSKAAEPSTPKKPTAVAGSSASTPARGTPDSSTAGDKKKKRHRLSAFIKKILD